MTSSCQTETFARRNRALVLLAELRDGNVEAREKLVLENLGLVHSVMARYFVPLAERDDAFSEGVLGLIRAIDGFDLAHKTTFSTYATIWINKRIYDYMSYKTRMIRLSESALALRRKIEAVEEFLGEGAPDSEVAKILGTTEIRIREVRFAPLVTTSTDSLEEYQKSAIGI